MFRKHPDWFVYDRFGQPQIGYSAQGLADLQQKNFEKYDPGTMAGAVNFANKQLLDTAMNRIVAAAKQYGFDGARFDNACYDVKLGQYDNLGHPLATTQQQADDKTRFALDHLRARLAASYLRTLPCRS